MAVDKRAGDGRAAARRVGDESPAAAASRLVRQARKGALGTLDPGTGHPYASLVTLATEPDGTPLMLVSRLALHTRNLDRDARASLMIDGTGVDGDPLAGGRVTLIGRAAPSASATAPRRFLARHPSAAVYAGFADFRFFAFTIERAHFVGGFGRIVDLEPGAFVAPFTGAADLIAAEAEIVAHMNVDHSDAVALVAMAHGGSGGDWLMTGIDPAGIDLVGPVAGGLRVAFEEPVLTPGAARRALVELTAAARRRLGKS